MGFKCLKATEPLRGDSLLPKSSEQSFDRPWKDERLSQPLSYLEVLNRRSMDWDSSALTSRPLLQKIRLPNCKFTIEAQVVSIFPSLF